MCSVNSAAANDYYLRLSRQDYYQSGVEPPGWFTGRGAEALGLTGVVEAEALRFLMDGKDAQGNPLVQNAGKPNRQQAWDCCFSAPKSVSVAWAHADEVTRQAIEAAHAAAVRAACGYLEDEAGWTRRGRGGTQRERARLVFAIFEHGSSRLGDPQLHAHSLCLNIGVRADGTTGTIVSKPIYQHKMAAGAVYRVDLAARLQKIGFTIERDGVFFKIAGVPDKLSDAFSKRRVQIDEQIKLTGAQTAAQAAAIALATRTAKKTLTRDTLREEWRQVGEAFGFGESEVARLVRPAVLHPADPAPLFRAGVDELLKGESFFSEHSLLRFAAEAAPGTGLDAADLRSGMKQFLAQEPSLVSIAPGTYTTQAVLALENELLTSAQQLYDSGRHQLPQAAANRAALKAEKAASARQKTLIALSEEQKAALEHVTTRAGSLQLVSGMAGTGKTFFLSAAKQAWEDAGYKVIGASLSGKAARGLQEGAGITSATVTRLLMDLDHQHWTGNTAHHLWQLGRAVKGSKTWGPPERMSLNSKTVLVIDEAGMLGNSMMAALLKAVAKAGAKLVLVGDGKQIQSIESGGSFIAMQERFGAAELSAIQRQREPWAREAVKNFAEGRAAEALGAYAERGLLTVTKTRHEAMERLLDDWKKGGIERPEDSLIFTGLRSERAVMNRWAQQERKKAGQLGFNWVTVDGERLYAGDRVTFTVNSKRLGVENGTLGTIEDVSLLGSRLQVRLDNGTRVSFALSQYRGLELAYASTVYRGQGCTVENAFVLAGGPTQNREQTYVQMSRARGDTRLYWDNAEPGPLLEPLAQAMQVSRQKEMASVILARNTPPVASPEPFQPTVAETQLVQPLPVLSPTPASVEPQQEPLPTAPRSHDPRIVPSLRPY